MEQIRTVPGNEMMFFNHEQRNANPPAWTKPTGDIYMGTTSPDYSPKGELDIDKIRSTIVHEVLHGLSHRHVGFQGQTDITIDNSNYDEFITDFFAKMVYEKLFPNAEYKTQYFTRDLKEEYIHWGGNIAKLMIDSGVASLKELIHHYFNTGELETHTPLGIFSRKLPTALLGDWKQFAKQA